MNITEQHMYSLGELLLCSDLYLFQFSPSFEILFTTCQQGDFCQQLFFSNPYVSTISLHFASAEKKVPIYLNDSVGIAWIAAPTYQNNKLHSYYVIGPAFSSSISETNLDYNLQSSQMAGKWKQLFRQKMDSLPIVSLKEYQLYASMLYYCINGERLSPTEALMLPNTNSKQTPETPIHISKHGTYYSEQIYFQAIEDGDLATLSKLQIKGSPGRLSNDNPLRSYKNQGIVLVTLATRASVRGGLPEELAYSISDQTILALESCRSINETIQVMNDFIADITGRIHLNKKLSGDDSIISSCYSYIEQHIEDKINFEHMSAVIGYNRNYLSCYFKKKTGFTLSEAVNIRKIERAKKMLSYTDMSIQDISHQLSFASPSYFINVFRKFSGNTPLEYRNNNTK